MTIVIKKIMVKKYKPKTKSKSKKPALLTAKANKELQKILKSKKLSENPNTIALYLGHCKRFFIYLKKKLHK